MFNFLKKKKKKSQEGGLLFTFIWYKKLQTGNTTHYTQPFKTTVTAKNRDEAFEKVHRFALNKFKLCVLDEEAYEGSDIMKFKKRFADLNKDFEEAIDNMKFKL